MPFPALDDVEESLAFPFAEQQDQQDMTPIDEVWTTPFRLEWQSTYSQEPKRMNHRRDHGDIRTTGAVALTTPS